MTNQLVGLGTRIGIIIGLVALPFLLQWLRGKDIEHEDTNV